MNIKEEIINLEVGSHNIINIEKVFGPLSMNDIRISIDGELGEWIIERYTKFENWQIVARIGGCHYNTKEEDIVKVKELYNDCKYDTVVEFEEGGYSPFSVEGDECEPEARYSEVIGNIYENPELLEKEEE